MTSKRILVNSSDRMILSPNLLRTHARRRFPEPAVLSSSLQRGTGGNTCTTNITTNPTIRLLSRMSLRNNYSTSSSSFSPSLSVSDNKDKGESNDSSAAADKIKNIRKNPSSHQRLWKAAVATSSASADDNNDDTEEQTSLPVHPTIWHNRVADGADDAGTFSELIRRIEQLELQGGRLRARQLGVLHEDPATDMELLTQNYTVTALAGALRDREEVLQAAAVLAAQEDWSGVVAMLKVFHPTNVTERRARTRPLNIATCLGPNALETIRKALMRMPRTVSQAYSQRAGVVIPLCLVDGVPSLLLEKRAAAIRAHADEVCLPGGMVCTIHDRTIVATCLREMQEEIGGFQAGNIQVLGVFRCNWGEVHHMVGVAVTPVVCFLGELPETLQPNAAEVSEVFTIPLGSFSDKSMWVHKEGMAPLFLGGPHIIWGLTGYILDRFYKDILLPNTRQIGQEDHL